VIENLLSNAIAYSPPGGRVRLAVTRTADRARVAVHDEGPGVPEEARQRIFEKFGTVETGEKRTRHSVGLGLAFCKLAVAAHGGTIGVTAGKPAGSVFWFEIPA
jgi:signal transduction histidine kinase